jgi:hypothetical protein
MKTTHNAALKFYPMNRVIWLFKQAGCSTDRAGK